jgi:hypothetical protein
MHANDSRPECTGADGVSSKAKDFIGRLEHRGVNDQERMGLLNVVEKLYPYGRRPLRKGDIVLYEQFDLADVFRIYSDSDATAISNAVAKAKQAIGVCIPQEDDLVKPNRAFLLPPPEEMSSMGASVQRGVYSAIAPEDRAAILRIILDLSGELSVAEPDQLRYDPGDIEEAQGFGSWLSAMGDAAYESGQVDGSETTLGENELALFLNELRSVLTGALLNLIVPNEQPVIA